MTDYEKLAWPIRSAKAIVFSSIAIHCSAIFYSCFMFINFSFFAMASEVSTKEPSIAILPVFSFFYFVTSSGVFFLTGYLTAVIDKKTPFIICFLLTSIVIWFYTIVVEYIIPTPVELNAWVIGFYALHFPVMCIGVWKRRKTIAQEKSLNHEQNQKIQIRKNQASVHQKVVPVNGKTFNIVVENHNNKEDYSASNDEELLFSFRVIGFGVFTYWTWWLFLIPIEQFLLLIGRNLSTNPIEIPTIRFGLTYVYPMIGALLAGYLISVVYSKSSRENGLAISIGCAFLTTLVFSYCERFTGWEPVMYLAYCLLPIPLTLIGVIVGEMSLKSKKANHDAAS